MAISNSRARQSAPYGGCARRVHARQQVPGWASCKQNTPRMASVARGAWLFLLNNDAVAAPDAIAERLMTFAADRPAEAGMLACRVVRYEEPHFFDSVGLLLYLDGVCRSRGWEEKDIGQYHRSEEVLAPHGCAGAYRKAMIDEVGPFDEAYFAYLEDLDLGMRGQLAGWRCWYVADATVRHRKSSTFGNYSTFKAYHVERNRIWNAVKLLPRFILLVSPLFTLNRYLLQGYAVATHQGLSSDFVKEYSYPRSPCCSCARTPPRSCACRRCSPSDARSRAAAAPHHHRRVVSAHQSLQARRDRAGPQALSEPNAETNASAQGGPDAP